MNEKIARWLYDIQTGIAEINDFFTKYPKRLDEFRSNSLLRSAVSWNVQLIARAVYNIVKEDTRYQFSNIKKITDLRDLQEYNSMHAVWEFVVFHLDTLNNEVNEYLKNPEANLYDDKHLIENNKQQIIEICKNHHISRLYVFGSVLTPNFRKDSDVDLLFALENPELNDDYFENYMKAKENFEKLFRRKVDLVNEESLKNKILIKEINRTKQLLYENQNT